LRLDFVGPDRLLQGDGAGRANLQAEAASGAEGFIPQRNRRQWAFVSPPQCGVAAVVFHAPGRLPAHLNTAAATDASLRVDAVGCRYSREAETPGLHLYIFNGGP
jgi:hypothetical protein